MGRRSLSRAGRCYPQGRSACPGYDLATHQIKANRRRITAQKEPHQGQRKSQRGASLPHPETSLRLCQGALPGLEEEPLSPVRLLRSGEPLPPPQTVGHAGAVVSLERAKDALSRQQTTTQRTKSLRREQKTLRIPLPPSKQRLAQTFPRCAHRAINSGSKRRSVAQVCKA